MKEVKIIDSKGNIRTHDISKNANVILNPDEQIIDDNGNLDGLMFPTSAVITIDKLRRTKGTKIPHGFTSDLDKERQKLLENNNKTIKFHFEISPEDYARFKRYYPSDRIRHEIARISFIEMLNRREGRDKKLQAEKLVKDSKRIQKMIDTGMINIPVYVPGEDK